MASTLRRLFLYAKSENEALENFTTEATAAAIRLDSAPFLEALRTTGLDLPAGPLSVHRVETQVGVAGAGVLDLIVVLGNGAEQREIWFEVKCHSLESGNQLAAYRAHITGRPAEHRPQLVVLAPRRLAGHEDLPWLPWQSLWTASSRKKTRTAAWWDLRHFLEEIRMANRFDSTITAHEASAQTDTFALLGKLERALEPVVAHAAKVAPALAWPQPGKKLRRMLVRHFGGWGAFTVASGDTFKAGLAFGAYPDDESRESWAGIRLWHPAKDLAVRKQLVALADSGKLPSTWERAPADDERAALANYVRLAIFESQPALSAWFIQRFDELRAAGIIEAIPALGDAPAEGASGEGDDE